MTQINGDLWINSWKLKWDLTNPNISNDFKETNLVSP